MKFLLLFLFFYQCNGAKILGVFNHPGASHTFLGKVLLKNLAKRGHEVTMISSFPLTTPIKNYKDIYLDGFLEDLKKREEQYYVGLVQHTRDLFNMTLKHTEDTFKHKEVQQLIKKKAHFDVIIMDWFFNDASLIFGTIFNAPVIIFSSFGNNYLLTKVSGNCLPHSYIPGLSLPLSDDIGFKARFSLVILNHLFYLLDTVHFSKRHYEILQRNFKNPPTIPELHQNIALIFSNSHFSIETPRPYTPNIIPVGGFHVEEPSILDHDLKKFMDEAKNGVIYFSLGSQVRADFKDNKNIFQNIFKVFSKLPQRIVIKHSSDNLENVPSNVKFQKWAPQLGILAHPNIKLFISHCGCLSSIESVHFAVPILCLSVHGDQSTNGAFMESRKIGKLIAFKDVNEENFYQAITTILNNKSYNENMKYYSSLLRDQPVKPLDNAIYWVEHVIKYRGAPHLRPFSTKLPLYKYYLLDVIGAILLIAFLFYKLICFIFKLMVIIILKLFSLILTIKGKQQKIE